MSINKTYLSHVFFNGVETPLTLTVEPSDLRSCSLDIKGYKHAMVQVISVAIALNIKITIENPPIVNDTYVFCSIINSLGGRAFIQEGKLIIDPTGMKSSTIPPLLGKMIHGSVYLMPAFILRFGKFEFYGSGGCQIGDVKNNGKRPLEHIIEVMKTFGVNIVESTDMISGELVLNQDIKEIDIMKFSTSKDILSGPLVGGATKVAMLLSLKQDKITIINPYLKTDVLDMIRFIRSVGKEVTIESDRIIIKNNSLFVPDNIRFELTQCISEIITYTSLAVCNNIDLSFKNLNRSVIMEGLQPEFELMKKMKINFEWIGNDLFIYKTKEIQACDIEVVPSSIQSDHQPFFALMLLKANGKSKIYEHVFKERFFYVENLKKLGADIQLSENHIEIFPSNLNKGSLELCGNDVRTAAVTLVACISSKCESKIFNCEHILRGYDSIFENMKKMGINIGYEGALKSA